MIVPAFEIQSHLAVRKEQSMLVEDKHAEHDRKDPSNCKKFLLLLSFHPRKPINDPQEKGRFPCADINAITLIASKRLTDVGNSVFFLLSKLPHFGATFSPLARSQS
jgi:hypothetical protein